MRSKRNNLIPAIQYLALEYASIYPVLETDATTPLALGHAFQALIDEDHQSNAKAVYDYLSSDVLDEKLRYRALDSLFSLVNECCCPSNQVSISVTDDNTLNEYFVTLSLYETGTSLKAGVKDYTSMRILTSEIIDTKKMYSGLITYCNRLAEFDQEVAVILLNSFYSSLISIIELCLASSNRHSSTPAK